MCIRDRGIPEYLVFRQPFPGPGLGIRIIGEVTAEKVRIVPVSYTHLWSKRFTEWSMCCR